MANIIPRAREIDEFFTCNTSIYFQRSGCNLGRSSTNSDKGGKSNPDSHTESAADAQSIRRRYSEQSRESRGKVGPSFEFNASGSPNVMDSPSPDSSKSIYQSS